MTLTAKEREALLQALPTRFEKNMRRHAGIAWAEVLARLDAVRPSQRRAVVLRGQGLSRVASGLNAAIEVSTARP
jgi:hypothetical protein